MTRFQAIIVFRLTAVAIIVMGAGARVHAQPLDPRYVRLPVMSRLTGWITAPLGAGGQEFGQSVMPVAAQSNGLPGVMIMHNRADTIARETYPVESLFYRGTSGRFPDSSDRQRIGMTEIGSEARLLCAGDWDGDGYRDLAMWLRLYNDSTYGGWNYRVGRVVVFWGNRREEYSINDTSRLIMRTEQWGNARNGTSADINSDGTEDLIVFGEGAMQDGVPLPTSRLHIFAGAPSQRWGRNGRSRYPVWSPYTVAGYPHMTIIDQDGDGALDIAFNHDNSGPTGHVEVVYGRAGDWPDSTSIELIDLKIANGHYSIFSDITGDGVPELLVNTGSNELIRIYAGARGQRLKDQYGSGYDPPMPGRGFWPRPWVEIPLPNKLDASWAVAGWGGLFDLGDANHDGINDIWLYCEPNIICYTTGKYLDELVDATITIPGNWLTAAANVGDISGTGRPVLAIGYDDIPLDGRRFFPGSVMFVRTDMSFMTNRTNARQLPVTTSGVGATAGEEPSVMRLYPNPARERAMVMWGEQARGDVRISIIDVLGREQYATVVDGRGDRVELDLHDLPAGSYRVVVRNGASIRSTALTKY